MRYSTILLILAVVSLFGCGQILTEGRQFDSSRVNNIMVGSTTGENLAANLGQPAKVETMPSGEKKYVYHYYYKNPHWWTTDEIMRQDLEVYLLNNEVQRYNYKEQATEYIDKTPPLLGTP